jgi:dihydrofolate reductase
METPLRKLIFPINVSVDGFADHTHFAPDEQSMDFFTEHLENTGVVVFGRETYNLMANYWPHVHEDPRATPADLRFAKRYNEIEKVVFSSTLPKAAWNNTRLLKDGLVDEVARMKQQAGKPISVGGISVAQELMRHGLIDECLLVVHPVATGTGRRLFEHVGTVHFALAATKVFKSGTVVLHYLCAR